MSQPSASPVVSHHVTPAARAPRRPWETVFLVALVVGLLASFLVKSNKSYLGHDDFCTTTLVSNPHFGQMLETIRSGGEVNPPLFFVLGWGMARVFGTGELPMRALSAIPLALAAVITFFALRRVVGARPAALSTALVFGLSRAVFDFMQNARYYGLFILLAALAAFLFIQINDEKKTGWRELMFVFLVHAALVWLHLFGVLFSGTWLAALVVCDWLRGRGRGTVYAAVAGAWVTFALWLPALKQQLQVTRDGTWTPRLPFGLFVDEPAMQTPLATVMLILAVLALTTLVTKAGDEAPADGPVPTNLLPLLILGLAWMSVPVVAWAGSQVINPFYMQRYVAPCVVALTFLVALGVWLIERLPRPAQGRLPPWIAGLAWTGAITFCLMFQTLRALQDGPRPGRPFEDLDFGHPKLPMVFEDSMDYLVRDYYGQGREYALILDRDAAEADPGYFTKLMERYFSKFRPHYGNQLRILYADELPAWPDGFLAVDGALAKTWEWVFAHQPGWQVELLGTWPDGQKVHRVRRTTP